MCRVRKCAEARSEFRMCRRASSVGWSWREGIEGLLRMAEGEAEAWDIQKEKKENDKDNNNDGDDNTPPLPGSPTSKETSTKLPKVSTFLDRIAQLHATKRGGHKSSTPTTNPSSSTSTSAPTLSTTSEREVRRILTWCERRFGTEAWQDASSEFPSKSGKYAEMAGKQLVGGEGWRDF